MSKLEKLETYIFIDVSNIRSACLRSSNFLIDFYKLIEYFNQKYPNLKKVGYFEGIAIGDKKKQAEFNRLKKAGYEIYSLKRRSYIDGPIYKQVICKKCGHKNRTQVSPKIKKMKSNVDVYLATEVLKITQKAKRMTHIIILSCDGDYAEAIKSAAKNEKVRISVFATPPKKDILKNTVSIRLKELRREIPDQYQLVNIESIKDKIKKSGSEDTLSNVRKHPL